MDISGNFYDIVLGAAVCEMFPHKRVKLQVSLQAMKSPIENKLGQIQKSRPNMDNVNIDIVFGSIS
jgi:hypothetical protein